MSWMFAPCLQASQAGSRDFCRRIDRSLSESRAHQFSHRSFPRPALEAQNKPESEGVGKPLEGLNARLVPAALDSRDRGVTGTDSPGQLLLGDAETGAVLDHQPGKLLELREALLLATVGRASLCAPRPRVRDRRSDGVPLGHVPLPPKQLITSDKTPTTRLRGVVTSGSGRLALQCVHPCPEIGPSFFGDPDLGFWGGPGVLPKHMQKDG